MSPHKIVLDERDLPTHWYNLAADLPAAAAAAAPGHRQPVGPDDLAPLFPMALILQEVSSEPRSRSPTRCATSTGSGGPRRCSARVGLEQALGTPGRIYYKYEGGSPAGLAQAQHRRAAGVLQRAGGRHSASPPRPAPASGAPRSRSPARSSTSSARSTWCGVRTTRSRTAAR